MPRGSKLTDEERIAAVQKYLDGKGSYAAIAKKYGINHERLRQIVIRAKTDGIEAVKIRRRNKKYSAETKLKAVTEYLEGKCSQMEICAKYHITQDTVFRKWMSCYNSGMDFKERTRSERGITMNKGRKTTQEERAEIVAFCIENGKDYGLAMEKYDVSYQQIYSWVHKYEAKGVEWIKQYYEERNGILGYRQMTVVINREHDVHFNKKRIYRLMQILHLKSVTRIKKNTYIPSTPQITAENILNRDFHADKPNEKWLTDVTEFKYYVGSTVKKLYLSAILDLYDRRIVAYQISDSNNNHLVFTTFDEAVRLNPDAHPIFHSDRGFQYTNKIFHQKLVDAKMIQSMSRVGRCIDNGPMEGWWGILKSEMYYLRKFTDKDELISAIEEYITYYNTRRYQIKLSCMTPMEYHEAYAA